MIPPYSEAAVDLVKESEGLRLTRYFDPIGIPTIGYGTVCVGDRANLMFVTEEQADELLNEDLRIAWEAIDRNVKVDLTQGQVDGLTSWVYNLGEGNLKKSTMLKCINAKDFERAANEMLRWNTAGGKELPGLVKRREKEHLLFVGDA